MCVCVCVFVCLSVLFKLVKSSQSSIISLLNSSLVCLRSLLAPYLTGQTEPYILCLVLAEWVGGIILRLISF